MITRYLVEIENLELNKSELCAGAVGVGAPDDWSVANCSLCGEVMSAERLQDSTRVTT